MQDFHYFLNSAIYFDTLTSNTEKEDIKSLILETLQKIEAKNTSDVITVVGNLEFIIYKRIEGDNIFDVNRSPDGGVTLRCEIEKSETQKSCWRCFVIYYPLKGLKHRETQLYILAHEFAHVFYQHPIIRPNPSRLDLDELERATDEKAIEWGFRPHNDDIDRSPNFKKFFGKNSQ